MANAKAAKPRRPSLTDDIVRTLLADTVAGRFPGDERLPQEGDLADSLGVSRLTLREATRTLQSIGVFRVERGRGTFVNPQSEWSLLEPAVLDALLDAGAGAATLRSLTELRRMLETGAVSLAAERRDDADLALMRTHLGEMTAANEALNVEAFAAADVAFHNAILAASANPLVLGVYRPIQGALQLVRAETSKQTIGSRTAFDVHRAIYDAIERADPAAAVTAMSRHFDNTARFVDAAIEAAHVRA